MSGLVYLRIIQDVRKLTEIQNHATKVLSGLSIFLIVFYFNIKFKILIYLYILFKIRKYNKTK